jgi:DnaK suppressor protein
MIKKRQVHSMSHQNRKSDHDSLRKLLLAKRNELIARVEQRRQEIVMDQEQEDEVGVALRNSATGLAIANIERELRTLAEIDLSLRRMESGAYGICGLCEEKIPVARLKAIPWTRCCVECAGGSVVRPRKIEHESNLLSTL